MEVDNSVVFGTRSPKSEDLRLSAGFKCRGVALQVVCAIELVNFISSQKVLIL
jgi:hypothetical protein